MKLYAIGVGPGESKYLTLKAIDALSVADIVFCPQSEAKKESLALSICQEHISPDAKIINLVFPMTKDKKILQGFWQKAADTIIEESKEIKTAAFITLGDCSIYSTYSYIIDKLKNREEITVETIPGITAFSACASALNIPLVESDEKLALLPATDLTKVGQVIDIFETIILYKVKGKITEISELLSSKNLLDKSFLISNVSAKNERISKLADADEKGYFSTIIIKKGLK
jgi:precorrin-2/cobalt-factor-2 C20-methyltransferase